MRRWKFNKYWIRALAVKSKSRCNLRFFVFTNICHHQLSFSFTHYLPQFQDRKLVKFECHNWQEKLRTYIFVLIDHIHPTSLELAHQTEVCPHRSSDKNVIKTVTVNVTSGDSVAKVCSDLISRQIVQVCQIGVVEHNLKRTKKSKNPELSWSSLKITLRRTFPVRFAPRGIPTAMSCSLSPVNSPVATEYPRYESSSLGLPSSVLNLFCSCLVLKEKAWPKNNCIFKSILDNLKWMT